MPVNRVPSKDISFAIDDSDGTLRVLTGVTEVSGLPGVKEHIEATAVGDGGAQWIESLQRVEFTVSGWYDTTASTGTKPVLSGIRDKTDYEGTFEYGPEGGASTKEKISGEAVMVDLDYITRLGEVVGFRALFKVAGVVTFGTYS